MGEGCGRLPEPVDVAGDCGRFSGPVGAEDGWGRLRGLGGVGCVYGALLGMGGAANGRSEPLSLPGPPGVVRAGWSGKPGRPGVGGALG